MGSPGSSRAKRGLSAAWLVFAFLIALCAPALAKTGGRAGGGSWGKASSSRSSSSSRSYSSPSRSYSSPSSSSTSYHYYGGGGGGYNSGYSSYDSSYGGGCNGGGIGLVVGVVFVLIVVGIYAIVRQQDRNSYSGFMNGYTPAENDGEVDVSVLRVAIDGRARKYVQTELARIGKLADTATDEGRLTLLREVCMLLRKVRDAWVYGGAVNEPMRGADAAKACFDHHVDDARMRIGRETISNVQGQLTTQDAGNFTPRSEQGEGVILVSIIVATLSELFTVRNIGDGEDLRKAIEAAPHRSAADLVAVEIVWMPSEDSDRMSSIELEQKYPAPQLIPLTGALVGKVFCAYCSGPFPAELVSCPHCGAPAPGHESQSQMPRAA